MAAEKSLLPLDAAQVAVIVWAERLRFAHMLRTVMATDVWLWSYGAPYDALVPLDLTDEAKREAAPGMLSVAKHARTLRLTGWSGKPD